MSRACGDVEKACAVQSSLRTAARASEKVMAVLAYHAARLGETRPRAASVLAQSVTSGYGRKTVCHGRGEYARDEDGDGFCEVHVNTVEGFWSLLRSWLRPHRGVSQEKLPLYLGFFQFVHNARRRGKALLGALIAGLVA